MTEKKEFHYQTKCKKLERKLVACDGKRTKLEKQVIARDKTINKKDRQLYKAQAGEDAYKVECGRLTNELKMERKK